MIELYPDIPCMIQLVYVRASLLVTAYVTYGQNIDTIEEFIDMAMTQSKILLLYIPCPMNRNLGGCNVYYV
jgi:hypothetical protein